VRVLASSGDGGAGDETFVLVPAQGGARFWLLLPFRVARQLRAFQPDAVVTQSPYEATAALLARRIARVPARLVTDVQGDWRTATRLYGSPARAALRPVADAVAAAALRRVDAVRTISPFTTRLVRELGIEPADTFPTFVDLEALTNLGTSVSHDNGMTWTKNPVAVQQSALDRHNVYQYRAFGVPVLALRRGQEEDLVVAPYAAALALGMSRRRSFDLGLTARLSGSVLLARRLGRRRTS